jgi:hypothetical protein
MRARRMRGSCGGKQQHELVAADARDRGALRRMVFDPARDLDQQVVADVVAIGVVDGFEAVEVDQHGHERAVGRAELADCLLQPIPVEQIRQRIAPGIAVHLGGEFPRLVFEATGLAEAGLPDQRASHHSAEEQHDGESQDVILDAAPGQHASGGDEKRQRHEIDRRRRVRGRVGDGTGRQAREHDQIERRLRGGVSVRQHGQERPGNAGCQRQCAVKGKPGADRPRAVAGNVRLGGGKRQARAVDDADRGEPQHRAKTAMRKHLHGQDQRRQHRGDRHGNEDPFPQISELIAEDPRCHGFALPPGRGASKQALEMPCHGIVVRAVE